MIRKIPDIKLLLAVGLSLAAIPVSAATFDSDGSDGAFNPLVSQTIILNDVAPDGIFNFTTINIPANVTIRFQRNTLNTPVIFAATGSVVIDGTISLSSSGRMGGAGGGDGGVASNAGSGDGAPGSGISPGAGGLGAAASSQLGNAGGGGGMATLGLTATSRSGSPPALGGAAADFPSSIEGGSGGGAGGRGRFFGVDLSGGDGGGAGGGLQISTIGNIDISGSLLANGGHGGYAFANVFSHGGPGGGGSGGNFELNASVISLTDGALIQAIGGAGGGLSTEPVANDPFFYSSGANGGTGYLKLDFDDILVADTATLDASVIYASAVPLPAAAWLFGSALLGLGMVKRKKA